MKRMELLAPVGGFDQLKAAVRFGADAVYGGMKKYGLRAFAGNFDDEELKTAVAFAHEHNVKFYVTMNMLPTDSDMDGFVAAGKNAVQAGVDAAIVADFGAALQLHDKVPELPIHISTQANVLNSRTAQHLADTAGATRIVLSRELSIKDISQMRQKLPESIELQAFVHGAMCVSYSGRCLLSAELLGRSGNRGACAQPCRWGYYLVEEKRPGDYHPVFEDENGTYLYSARDLCMIGKLHDLRKAGVVSLKIEGRMKTAYYVASVVSAYRKAIDLLEQVGEEAYLAAVPQFQNELQKVSHRVSNTGFYYGMPSPPAGANGFEQTMEYIADVIKPADENCMVRIRLKNRFFATDRLEVLTPDGVYSFVPGKIIDPETGEEKDKVTVAGSEWLIPIEAPVGDGDVIRGENRNHL